MKEVSLYTDGACRGNPGRGGWGAILVYGKYEKEMSGGERETTNNRMELTAAIEGLSALKEPCYVTLYSDSKYLVDAYEEGWIYAWEKAAWRGGKVKNPDLWQRMLELTRLHTVTFVWVKGHNGHKYNERCDALATAFADSFEPEEKPPFEVD
ncbi:MAG: ribonuclease HI [Clostridia bacterium]|nr:ribonuclease HI [Clostridia bacterium]